MKRLRAMAARLRALFGQQRAENEFSSEIEEHVRLLAEQFQSRGMSREEAQTAARRQFGNTTLLSQRQRERRIFPGPGELWRDVVYGIRMLRKHPGSTAAVIIALAFGIGMNSCVFTFVNSLLLRPPTGVRAPGELREVWQSSRNPERHGLERYMPFTFADYIYFRDHSRSYTGLMAYDGDSDAILWNHNGQGDVVHAAFVSGNFFSVAGVNMAMGRGFTPEDDQPGSPQPLVILNYNFWRQRLAADASMVGKPILLNGLTFTIVGIAPQGFTGFIAGETTDFWTPLAMVEQTVHDPGRLTNRSSNWLMLEGRLAPGATSASAQAEASLIAREIERQHPDTNKDMDADIFSSGPIPGFARSYVEAFTGLLMLVFGLVLVIACANAVSMLMVKATGRMREMAVRAALGATRGRLLRQLTIESILLSLIAGVAAIGLAAACSRLLLNLVPANLPITVQVPIDWRVLVFTFAVSLVTGILFGAIPAQRGTRVDPARVLREEVYSGGFQRSRFRLVLMTGQVALCALLLFGAVLCVRSLLKANSMNPGFDTHNIATAELDPGSLGYTGDKVDEFYRNLTARMRATAGVASMSYVNHLPLDASREATGVALDGAVQKDHPSPVIDVFRVAPEYFATMGIPMLRGRDFSNDEFAHNASVIVVNDTMAAELWPGQDPTGKMVRVGDEKTASEVIGVVRTGKYRTLGEEPLPALYRLTMPPHRVIVVRTRANPEPMLEVLRRQTQRIDPKMAATQLQTIGDFMSFPLFPARATGLLLGASGLLALILTWIGLFGVISFAVSQRTREIGVRMALGARRGDVLKLVMRQGLWVAAIGLAIGMAAALAAARLLASLLYGVRPSDPITILAVLCGLFAAVLLACYLPARRAMRVNPTEALRYE